MNIPLMKRQRERLGLRQEDVAAAVGVDRSSVAGWETGKAYPDPRRIRLLAEVLQITSDELLAQPEAVATFP